MFILVRPGQFRTRHEDRVGAMRGWIERIERRVGRWCSRGLGGAWVVDVACARDASVVAVGHTRDDQAETILHRILRGTGPRGLAGIPPSRVLSTDPTVTLVRPLLAVSRREIRDYLAAIAQPFRE